MIGIKLDRGILMSKSKQYTCTRRFVVIDVSPIVSIMEPMSYIGIYDGDSCNDIMVDEDSSVRISVGNHRYIRQGLSGVPASRVDAALHFDGLGKPPYWIEVGEKIGRYDGNVRDRITVRPLPFDIAKRPIILSAIMVDSDALTHSISILEGGVVCWARMYNRLRSSLNGTSATKIIGFQYANYFTHLRKSYDADVQALILSWCPSSSADLNRAHREASAALYYLSIQLGWKKLSKERRERYGLDAGPQWIRSDELNRIMTHRTKDQAYYASMTPSALDDGWVCGSK